MIRLAANLSTLFTEQPFLDRFGAAARAGFRWVEYQFPYAQGSPQLIAERARAAGVRVVLHNIATGDEARGDRGIACLPDRVAEFRASLAPAVEYAVAAGCAQLNCLAGLSGTRHPRQQLLDTLTENVAYAADLLRRSGLNLLVEPVNSQTNPGFLLTTSQQAMQVIDAAARPNVFLQYDIFHMQISEGNLATTLRRLLPRIGHIQLADVPGRHEPGTGEVNFPWLLEQIDRLGYLGAIGCEYLPSAATDVTLAWAAPWLARSVERESNLPG